VKRTSYIGRLLGIFCAAASLLTPEAKAQSNIVTYPTANDMAASRAVHHSLVLPDGRFAVVGDISSTTIGTNLVEVYDPETRRFQTTGRLLDTRWFESAAALADGRILVASGRTNISTQFLTSSAELFNPTNGTSTRVGNVNLSRFSSYAITLDDGRVLIAGGTSTPPAPLPMQTELFNPATGLFTLSGTMLVSRPFAADMCSVTKLSDGRILFTGGTSAQAMNAEIFDPATETFHLTGPMVARRTWHSATLLPDGRVVIIGGGTNTLSSGYTNLVEVFDPITETFSALGTNAITRRNHSATLLPDGRILVAGGWLPTANGSLLATSSVEIFDPTTGTSEYIGEMASRRAEHRVAALPNGQLIINGGRQETGVPYKTAEIFDPLLFMRPDDLYAFYQEFANLTLENQQLTQLYNNATNIIWGLSVTNSNLQGQLAYANQTVGELQSQLNEIQPNPFRLLPDTLIPRLRPYTYPLPDGRVVIQGGTIVPTPAGRVISIYDPKTEHSYTAGTNIDVRIGQMGNLLPDGRILFSGGSIRIFSPGIDVITNSTEIYDPGTSNVVYGPNMINPRMDGFSATLADGRVLVMAGKTATSVFLAQSEIYEPSNNVFRLSGVMPARVLAATVTRLQDGRIFIFGSSTNTAPVVQIFDPATETFTSVSGAPTLRFGHQASLLTDGRVLISGGRAGTTGPILSTTEIFDPTTGSFTAGPNLLTARFNFTSTTLPDGTVLVAGGQTNITTVVPATVQAEIFNPTTGNFSAAGVMVTNQYNHAAALLENGTVLFTGGSSGISSVTRAQLYDPTTHVRTSVFNNLSLLVDDLEAANASLSSQLSSVQQQLANANATISGLVVTNAQLQQELADCQAEKAALITQINTLTNQIAQLQGTIATLTAQNNALTNQVAQQQATIITLGTQVNSLTNTVAQQQVTIASLTAQNNALTNQVAQLQSTVSSLQTQNSALTNQVATLTAQNAAQAATITQQQSALTAEQANSQALAAQVAQQQALIASLQTQNTTLTNQVATLTTANQQLQTQVTGAQTQVNALNSAFQSEFSDPTFVIPGATLQQQVQNLINAILDLNHGQRKAVYNNLD